MLEHGISDQNRSGHQTPLIKPVILPHKNKVKTLQAGKLTRIVFVSLSTVFPAISSTGLVEINSLFIELDVKTFVKSSTTATQIILSVEF